MWSHTLRPSCGRGGGSLRTFCQARKNNVERTRSAFGSYMPKGLLLGEFSVCSLGPMMYSISHGPCIHIAGPFTLPNETQTYTQQAKNTDERNSGFYNTKSWVVLTVRATVFVSHCWISSFRTRLGSLASVVVNINGPHPDNYNRRPRTTQTNR